MLVARSPLTLPSPRRGEGIFSATNFHEIIDRMNDFINDGMDVVADIVIGEADEAISELLQIGCTSRVVLHLFGLEMGRSVNFDAQFNLGTIEIDNEAVNWVLAAKFIAESTIANGAPEGRFSGCLRMAHFTRKLQDGRVDAMAVLHKILAFPSPRRERVFARPSHLVAGYPVAGGDLAPHGDDL